MIGRRLYAADAIVVQGLNRVEKSQVEDVELRTVRRLNEEFDVPAVGRARCPDVRVVADAVRRGIVVIGVDGLTAIPRRPAALDRGNHGQHHLLVDLPRDLHVLRHHRPLWPVSAVALLSFLLRLRKDPNLPAEISVPVRVDSRPGNHCCEHEVRHVRLAPNLAVGSPATGRPGSSPSLRSCRHRTTSRQHHDVVHGLKSSNVQPAQPVLP